MRLLLNIKAHDIVAITSERTYVLPHYSLREVISHYTIYTPHNTSSAQPSDILHIVPDASGCIVSRINRQHFDIFLWGSFSKIASVQKNAQDVSMIIMVEFLPGGAGRLLNIPQSSLHNKILLLQTVDSFLFRHMETALNAFCEHTSPDSIEQLLNHFDQIFIKRLEYTENIPLVSHIISQMKCTDGMLRVTELSDQTRYSQRHLNRVMMEQTGMSIKLLARILRINAACRQMALPSISMMDVACQFGYHDQSHFIHDFSEIFGITPGLYRQRMSDFYNEDLKLGAMIPHQ